VLVASDAIGMGLNLNISRVVFSTLHKFDGYKRRLLTDSEIKQIAGRAGRYRSIFPTGEVTAYAPPRPFPPTNPPGQGRRRRRRRSLCVVCRVACDGVGRCRFDGADLPRIRRALLTELEPLPVPCLPPPNHVAPGRRALIGCRVACCVPCRVSCRGQTAERGPGPDVRAGEHVLARLSAVPLLRAPGTPPLAPPPPATT
jgi:hypothetical protein